MRDSVNGEGLLINFRFLPLAPRQHYDDTYRRRTRLRHTPSKLLIVEQAKVAFNFITPLLDLLARHSTHPAPAALFTKKVEAAVGYDFSEGVSNRSPD